MSTYDPFARVSSKYGAPMGRPQGSDSISTNGKVCAVYQRGGGGYDKGGADWGTPSDVWGVWMHGRGTETVHYVRALNKETAITDAMGTP